jgi:hypothetical protein
MFAWNQGMPETLTFADHLGFELLPYDDEVVDENDSDYDPNADSDAYSTSDNSSDGDDSSDSDDSFGPDDDHPDDHWLNDNIVLPTMECRRPTGVELAHNNHNIDDESDDDGSNDDIDDENRNIEKARMMMMTKIEMMRSK